MLRLIGGNTLSVNVIVKDGVTPPADIERALRSVARVADEYVVVDTGSTDGTMAVLRQLKLELPIRVLKHRFHSDFAEARNYALLHSTSAWIFWLDADEEVPPESVERIGQLIQGERKGYIFRLHGAHIPGEGAPQLRLFPNDSRLFWLYAVHEQIAPVLRHYGYAVEERPDVSILHHGYTDASKMRRSLERNIEIAAHRAAFDARSMQIMEASLGWLRTRGGSS